MNSGMNRGQATLLGFTARPVEARAVCFTISRGECFDGRPKLLVSHPGMLETPRLQAKQGCHSEAAPRNLSTSDQDRFGQMILLNPPYPFFRFFGLGREFGIRIRVRLDR